MMKKSGVLRNDLALFRIQRGWSQQQVADLVGVSRQTIISLEANRYNPSLILAFELALLYDRPLTELFHYKQTKL